VITAVDVLLDKLLCLDIEGKEFLKNNRHLRRKEDEDEEEETLVLLLQAQRFQVGV
jgi:hypothetical protein